MATGGGLCFGVVLSAAVVGDGAEAAIDAVVMVLANSGCMRRPNRTKYMINLRGECSDGLNRRGGVSLLSYCY